jgi:hypothetical protein
MRPDVEGLVQQEIKACESDDDCEPALRGEQRAGRGSTGKCGGARGGHLEEEADGNDSFFGHDFDVACWTLTVSRWKR